MVEPILKIAVGRDRRGWHDRFVEAIEIRKDGPVPLSCSLVSLDRSDWTDQVADSDLVIWKPPYMGHEFSGYMKERIYFLERFMDKVVVPGFDTVWHFESKAAQSFLFKFAGVPSPRTFVGLDLEEALERAASDPLPVVLKNSAGAGSVNVRSVHSRRELLRIVRRAFSPELWDRSSPGKGKLARLASSLGRDWFPDLVRRRLSGAAPFGIAYWQEFVPGNAADLRVTVIGDCFATGFWRCNRPGDFRASGSGLIDYDRAVPETALRLCLDINARFSFDSMAYDILFKDGGMLVTEMSYGYSDTAVHGIPGHWVLENDGGLRFVGGNIWPQELWVEWAIRKAARRGVPRRP